jgi:hypothetical protein
MVNNLNQIKRPKRKHSFVGKKSKALHKRFLFMSVFVPLGVELIRLTEELLKIFKP